MLCSDQQCSYSHWVRHANYKINQNTKSQKPSSQDMRIFDKRDVVISKILHEYRQKPPPSRSKQKHCDGQRGVRGGPGGVRGPKYPSQESILIPKDPTSPYAFTLNVNSLHKRKKKHVINQVRLLAWYSCIVINCVRSSIIHLFYTCSVPFTERVWLLVIMTRLVEAVNDVRFSGGSWSTRN